MAARMLLSQRVLTTSMQGIDNSVLPLAINARMPSNAASQSSRSNTTDEQQQFAPLLRAASDRAASKPSEPPSGAARNNSPTAADKRSERSTSGNKKPESHIASTTIACTQPVPSPAVANIDSADSHTSFDEKANLPSQNVGATPNDPKLLEAGERAVMELAETTVEPGGSSVAAGKSQNTVESGSDVGLEKNIADVALSAGALSGTNANASGFGALTPDDAAATSASALSLTQDAVAMARPVRDTAMVSALSPSDAADVQNSLSQLGGAQFRTNDDASKQAQKSSNASIAAAAPSQFADNPLMASVVAAMNHHSPIPPGPPDSNASSSISDATSQFPDPNSAASSANHHQQDSRPDHGSHDSADPGTVGAAPGVDAANLFSANLAAADSAKPGMSAQAIVNAPPPTGERNSAHVSSIADPSPGPVATPQQLANIPEPATAHLVRDAQLIQTAAHTEMRISMRSDQLGSIEVRAHSVGDEIGAAITVEKRDAHTALAIELPALQQALNDKQLHVEKVVLTHASLGAAMGDAQTNSRQQAESHAPRNPPASFYFNGGASDRSASFSQVGPSAMFNSQGRLSVHA
jgi:Flagellar hook-length control protein FliK